MQPGFYTHCLECDDYEILAEAPTDSSEVPQICEGCFSEAVQAVEVTACELGPTCTSDHHHHGLDVHVEELDL